MISEDIKELMLMRGQLVFVTGARSVGKSLLVGKLCENLARTQEAGVVVQPPQPHIGVVKVDGRMAGTSWLH